MSLQRVSRASYERLKEELENLKGQRVGIVDDIREAREQGDLKENFAYHDAKDRQGLLEARISTLELRLEESEVVEGENLGNEVMLGVTVTVRNKETGKERPYTLVTEEERHQVDNAASAESPVGQALMGKKVGDTVEVQGPNGAVYFEILNIEG
ncbi:MAG: transcription elongation factor GreA [Abditibacteriaceae bacterium]